MSTAWLAARASQHRRSHPSGRPGRREPGRGRSRGRGADHRRPARAGAHDGRRDRARRRAGRSSGASARPDLQPPRALGARGASSGCSSWSCSRCWSARAGRPWLGLLALRRAARSACPLTIGGDTANLLVPLYVVIAAGVLSAVRWLRPGTGAGRARAPRPTGGRLACWRSPPSSVLYALQALYSSDLEHAVKNIGFFYIPFVVLYRLLRRRRLDARAARPLLWLDRRPRAGLRGDRLPRVRHRAPADLQREGPRGQRDQAVLPRQLAVLRPEHLRPLPRAGDDRCWPRRCCGRAGGARPAASPPCSPSCGPASSSSLSQSSFAALLVGLAVLAALRWKVWPVRGDRGAGSRPAIAVVRGRAGRDPPQERAEAALDKATSGRDDLDQRRLADVRATGRSAGFGSGAFDGDLPQARARPLAKRCAAVSHTIPVTVAAEQGVIGLVAYLALLVARLRRCSAAACAARLRPAPAAGPTCRARASPPRSARWSCTRSSTRRSSRTR